MAVVRLLVAAVLLVTVAAGLAWVVSLAPSSAGAEASGEFRVVVVGLDGEVEWDRVVHSGANPLSALHALATAEGFTVDVEQQAWIGSGCTAEYVVGIAGQRETTTGGWNYYVRTGGGPWQWKSAGAACFALESGDEVEWCWVELDTCDHHVP